MNLPSLSLSLFGILAIGISWQTSHAQTATPIEIDVGVNRSRISEQRVQRQTEVMRLEGLLESIKMRIVRLERQSMAANRLPAITIDEAEAALAYATARLQESQNLRTQGEVANSQLAAVRLEVARAQGQLIAAKAAAEENGILLELDVVDADRRLVEQTQRLEQSQRMVAKGYTSSDALRLRQLDFERAKRIAQLARLRLEHHERASKKTETMTNTD